MTTTHCPHDDVALVCPFGCGETVDSDTSVCSRCREMVAPNAECVLCESVIMEAVPHGMSMDHVRATVEDRRQEAVLMAQLTASVAPKGGRRLVCQHGTMDPDNESDPCMICAMASAEEMPND